MGLLQDDVYAARWVVITRARLHELAISTASELLVEYTEEEVGNIIDRHFRWLFWTTEVIDTITRYHILRRKFNRAGFEQQYPEVADRVDAFCFMFRTRIALSLHPERIQELADFLKERNIKEWKPSHLIASKNDQGHWWLMKWFSENCRTRDGEKDWIAIHSELIKIYPCTFSYSPRRAPFTIEQGLSIAREIAEALILEHGWWSPEHLLEKDSSICEFLRKRTEFRRPAERPDLILKQAKWVRITKKTQHSRPDWFLIASAMGERYLDTLQLGNVKNDPREQQYRSFENACEELDETTSLIMKHTGKTTWSIREVERFNQNLYLWFKKHARKTDGSNHIDWEKIFSTCLPITKDSHVKNP